MGHADHPIRLSGPPQWGVRTGAPGLLAVDDVEFVAALEARLGAESWPARGWPQALAGEMLGADGQAPRLYQPIHRRFSLALLDAHCELLGQPRVDPKRIVARGLVLRRYVGPAAATAADRAVPQHWQAWRGTEAQPLGWRPLGPASFDADPDDAVAPPRSGNAAIDRLLTQRIARRRGPAAPERVVPLWPLHPSVAQAVGRTLLFGLVPTSVPASVTPSAAERAASFESLKASAAAQRTQLDDWLSPWFTRARATTPPRAGQPFDASWLQQTRIPPDEDRFIEFIEQTAYELDAFGAGQERWRPLLAQIEMWRFDANILTGWPYRRLDSRAFFSAAARVVRPELGAGAAAVMPHFIGPRPGGEPSSERFAVLRSQLLNTSIDGFAAQEAAQPMPQGAMEDDTARYAVRAFIKVKDHADCPPRLIWSEPSVLFSIAPWFESTGTLAPPIPLPRLDRDTLRKLKPNAGFSLPGDVRRLLRPNGAQALLAGNPRLPSGGLDWVLQLSIPIMTVCALVAMTIILTLLDAVFRWIPFAWILTPRVKK